jgi:type IV pilus assembly protein PilC
MASLRKENLFPRQLIEAATVGERTQTLAAVFDVLADRYQRELQSPLLARSLEVFLMVLLAVLVGILVIAMYLPIFVLASAV